MRKIKRIELIIAYLYILATPLKADEGLWLPQLDSTLYSKLKEMGLLLSNDEIYNNNKSSLSNAVILFNEACSGAFVSPKGLIFTNYHCCTEEIKAHIPVEYDSELNGFCAKSQNEEIPISNLHIKSFAYMQDVSDNILRKVVDSEKINVEERIKQLIKEKKEKDSTYQYVVSTLFEGNKYILYAYEVFSDIRLVCIPPSSVGRFGDETDNWEWPRYSSDFALFRVYVDKENKSAQYASSNIPYNPAKYIPITLNGYKENDLSLVLGFPSSGNPLEVSNFVSLMVNDSYPLRSALYSKQIQMLEDYSSSRPSLNLNSKTWIKGLKNRKKMWESISSGIGENSPDIKKKEREMQLVENIASEQQAQSVRNLQEELNKKYTQMRLYSDIYDVHREGLSSIRLLSIAQRVNKMLRNCGYNYSSFATSKNLEAIESFYNEYDDEIDRKFFIEVMNIYADKISDDLQISDLVKNKNGIDKWSSSIYSRSAFTSYDKLIKAIELNPNKIAVDPAVSLINNIDEFFNNNLWVHLVRISKEVEALKKSYYREVLSAYPNGTFWDVADKNIRLSYGQVKGYSYNNEYKGYQTSFDEKVEMAKSRGVYNYTLATLDEKFKKNNLTTFPICFITNSQTSSGSSGSPVLNAKGELIGLNFDRNQSGTIGDLLYDENTFRNIVVDIRYIMFIIETYFEDTWLVNELLLTTT